MKTLVPGTLMRCTIGCSVWHVDYVPSEWPRGIIGMLHADEFVTVLLHDQRSDDNVLVMSSRCVGWVYIGYIEVVS